MLSSKCARWATSGANSSHQMLGRQQSSVRHLSLYTSHGHARRPARGLFRTTSIYPQQARCISLFGWGDSSKAASTDAASPLPTVTEPTPSVDIGPSSLNNIRTVKASHSTSDVPDPSIPQPQPLAETLQEIGSVSAGSEISQDALSHAEKIASVPERIGYLKEVCGLDYGWGPTASMQYLFEHIHLTAGLGWTASIVVLASLLRATMVKPMIDTQKETAKMQALAPITKPIKEKAEAYKAAGNNQKYMELIGEISMINKEANFSYVKMFLPMLIQFPFQFGAFRMLSGAGKLPVPGFIHEGFLWVPDLGLSDPYFIIPAFSAGLIYLQFRRSMKANRNKGPSSSPMTPELMSKIGKILPALSFVFMIFQPSAVQIYFATSSVWAYGTTAALQENWFRKRVGLDEVPGTTGAVTATTAGATAAKTISEAGNIGKFRLSRPVATPVIETVVTQPEAPRSSIDKGIDSVKSTFSNLQTWSKKDGIVEKWQKSSADKEAKAKIARHEHVRKQQLDREREHRNEMAKRSLKEQTRQ